jgi:hypothetical protein
VNKYDKLEELTKQRKRSMEEKATVQKVWDFCAERMNQAGADLLDIEDRIRSVEGQIDMLVPCISVSEYWRKIPIKLPESSHYYYGSFEHYRSL